MISFIPIPFALALLTDTDLRLYAVKTFMSVPDSFSSSLTHVDNVSLPTGQYGFPYEITSSFTSSMTSSFRRSKYDNKQHNFIFSLYAL